MKTKSILLMLTITLTFIIMLCSNLFGSYMIGAYVHNRPEFGSANSSLSTLLQDGWFNTAISDAWDMTSTTDIQDMITTMNTKEINGILNDFIFDKTNQIYGARTMSMGNDFKFEAEYHDNTSISPFDVSKPDCYFYMSSNTDSARVGHLVNSSEATSFSNKSFWQVNNGQVGYAYKDLTYKWSIENSNIYYRVGSEFRFPKGKTGDDTFFKNNELFVTYALQCPDIDSLPDTTRLAAISFTYKGKQTDSPDSVNVFHHPDLSNPNDSCFVSYITKAKYNISPQDPDHPLLRLVTVAIPFKSLISYEAMSIDTQSDAYMLINLNPYLYWYGHGILKLDYIEFQDKLFKDYTSYNSELAHIRTFNYPYLYGYDEPKQGQFESFYRISRYWESVPNAPQLVSAINQAYNEVKKPDGTKYQHRKAYLDAVIPKTIFVDEYPFIEYCAPNWTSTTSPAFVQKYIDRVCYEYNYCRSLCGTGKQFIAVPQTYGRWSAGSTNKWYYLYPPDKVAKSLQLLPLCYKADGIIDFLFYQNNSAVLNNDKKYGLVNRVNGSSQEITPQYYAVQEANKKIQIYGPIIKDNLNWLGAESIMTISPSINLSGVLLENLYVPPINNSQLYQGYVQSGLYTEVTTNNPYIMLVNRRASIAPENLNSISPGIDNLNDYNNACYPNPSHPNEVPSQIVRLSPDSTAYSTFGTEVALYDPYDKALYKQNSYGNIDVPIGPGDGKLLQMVGTLPSTINANASIKSTGYLQGNIHITNGANVTFDTNSKVTLYPFTNIYINQGCTLTVKGELTLLDNAIISVDGGNLIIQNADCKFGNTSIISAEGSNDNGDIYITNSTLDKQADVPYWVGIVAIRVNSVRIENSYIKNALAGVHSYNSNLRIFNTRFDIPHIANNYSNNDTYGMWVQNTSASDKTTSISSDDNSWGFYGDLNNPTETSMTIGLQVTGHGDSLYVNNQMFHNLHYGINAINASNHGDIIYGCEFSNCVEGIKIIANDYSGTISYCDFFEADSQNLMTGIHLINSSPAINNCQFINCRYMGILAENITFLDQNGFEDCTFSNCNISIAGRNTSNEIRQCSFEMNQCGLLCFDGANFRLAPNAYNSFYNKKDNIAFTDAYPFMASIQLVEGHNDFHHVFNHETGFFACDFNFDRYYSSAAPLERINADYNWFADNEVRIRLGDESANPDDYVHVVNFDEQPHLQPMNMNENRFFVALQYECDQMFEQACALYKEILDAPTSEEEQYLNSCTDGIYRITLYMQYPVTESIDYFDEKVLQYAVSDPYLSKLLESYLLKEYILGDDFQQAIDLIQPRIDNPISELDSLRAVLDIEIILQLATYSNSKAPINTTCSRYKYKDIATFSKKHEENWAKYMNLLNNEEDNSIPVPSVATLYQNYPNPFNPSTTISFSVPKETPVKINLYNIKGQMVKQLCNKTMPKGQHKLVWDGKNEAGKSAGSGIYLIRLETKDRVVTKKAMMLK